MWGSRTPGHDQQQVPLEKAMVEGLLVLAVPTFSQAEQLQQLVPPGVAVVKCLNTVSAYELENTSDTAGKTVGT